MSAGTIRRWVESGRCRQCGGARDTDGAYCGYCRDRRNRWEAEVYARRRAAGLCRCGLPSRDDGEMCGLCLDVHAARRRRDEAESRCSRCPAPAAEGLRHCRPCLDRLSRRRQRRRAAGLCHCGRCGVRGHNRRTCPAP